MNIALKQSMSNALHRMLAPLRFAESYPALLIAGALLMLGMSGVWVNMPLSGSHRLSALSSASRDIMLISACMMGLFLMATAIKQPMLRLLVALCLSGFVFTLAQQFSFFDGEGMLQYITESQQFREMQHVLALHDVPNAGRSVETPLVFDAYAFSERLAASAGMLAWGPKLALLTAMVLTVYAWAKTPRWLHSSLLVVVFAAALVLLNGTGSVLLAYLKLNQGIRDLNNNQVESAIVQLAEITELDPVIEYSTGFPLLKSYMAYQVEGPESPLASAYVMSQRLAANDFSGVLALHDVLLRTKNHALLRSNAMDRVEVAMTQTALNRMALLALWDKDWYRAEDYYQQGLQVGRNAASELALLYIYKETRQHDACNLLADNLIPVISNRSVEADIWTTKGDCLAASGRILEARDAYEHSIQLDSDKNYRAVKGLSGS